MLLGITPVNLLLATLSCSKLLMFPTLDGNGPLNLLKLTSKTVTFLRFPICGGKQPVKLSLERMISLSVFPIRPILPGMQPPRSLSARTKAETGEFPMFSGIPNRNRLWFKNMASSSLSKSLDGIPPSNSL